MREYSIKRDTRETQIELKLNLDGGSYDIKTNCGFLNHMLELFAVHSGFGLEVKCVGDVDVDFHHTVEDVGIALGQAFLNAIGNKAGIKRYGDIILPMDETLVMTAVDISGRAYLNFDVAMPSAKVLDDGEERSKYVGAFDSELIEEFFVAFTRESKITLHTKLMYGKNTHHIIEGVFKAFARVLKIAVTVDGDKIPSSKGVL